MTLFCSYFSNVVLLPTLFVVIMVASCNKKLPFFENRFMSTDSLKRDVAERVYWMRYGYLFRSWSHFAHWNRVSSIVTSLCHSPIQQQLINPEVEISMTIFIRFPADNFHYDRAFNPDKKSLQVIINLQVVIPNANWNRKIYSNPNTSKL